MEQDLADLLQQRWDTEFMPSSHASTLPFVNASTASKANSEAYELFVHTYVRKPNTLIPQYSIGDLTSTVDCGEDHGSVQQAMKNWLIRKLRPRGARSPQVVTGTSLGPYGENPIWLRPTTLQDIALVQNGLVQVQLEVESNKDRVATIRKLGYGLCDQLRYLKNRGVTAKSVSGIYVPVTSSHVEKVTCSWYDEYLKYFLISEILDRQQVVETIKDLLTCHLAFEISSCSTGFKLPLTPSYVQGHFGPTSSQLKSGASVVLRCPRDEAVYKSPLTNHEQSTLRYLLGSTRLVLHSAYPHSVHAVQKTYYFRYNEYLPPLRKSEARRVIVPLVKQVVTALTELHTAGNAHLDVRLENMFSETN